MLSTVLIVLVVLMSPESEPTTDLRQHLDRLASER